MSFRISSRLRAFVLLLAALWLPLQTAAAMVAPLCLHGGQGSANDIVPAGEHAHHDHAAPDPAEGAAGPCDLCGFCHLAGGSLLPSASFAAALYAPPATLAVAPAPTFHSHIGELPHRPPRSA